MIESYWLAAATALWLGILTSISPCPLATNIAAVTYIGRQLDSPRRVALSGVVYTLGRVLTYLVLGIVLVHALISVIGVSDLLQRYMNKILGPFLILAGMVLLELLSVRIPGIATSAAWQKRASQRGVLSAGLLGMVFALSFCPVSAALFFGSLIPLSVDHGSSVLFPSLFGLGTGLPVVVIGLGLGMGAHWVGSVFDRLTAIERWARRITGVVFVLVGVYLSLVYIFGAL